MLGAGVFMVSSGLMDDGTIHALNDEEAKKKIMLTASLPRLEPFNLINCQTLRLKPTLCYPNLCCRSAAMTAEP
jgi:hypothetical protein